MSELTEDHWTLLVGAAQAATDSEVGPEQWRRALEDVLPLYGRMVYPVLLRQRDHARSMVADILDDRDRAQGIAVELENEVARLRDFVRELRVPVANDRGPHREVVVQRLMGGADRWAVMDGPGPGNRAWHAGRWLRLGEIAPAVAYKHRLDEALDLALQVAEVEGACSEAEFLAQQDGEL